MVLIRFFRIFWPVSTYYTIGPRYLCGHKYDAPCFNRGPWFCLQYEFEDLEFGTMFCVVLCWKFKVRWLRPWKACCWSDSCYGLCAFEGEVIRFYCYLGGREGPLSHLLAGLWSFDRIYKVGPVDESKKWKRSQSHQLGKQTLLLLFCVYLQRMHY